MKMIFKSTEGMSESWTLSNEDSKNWRLSMPLSDFVDSPWSSMLTELPFANCWSEGCPWSWWL